MEEWLPTLNSGMEEYSAMLQRRVSPPVNDRVTEAWMEKWPDRGPARVIFPFLQLQGERILGASREILNFLLPSFLMSK